MSSVRIKGRLVKFKEFIACHRTQVIVSLIVVTFILGGVIFYNKISSEKDARKDIYVSKNPKSVDDLTESEKEIIGITKKDSKKEEKEKYIENNISDSYKEYEKLSDKEKQKLEVIPRKEEIPYEKIDEIKEDTDYTEDIVIPDRYNLNEHIKIKVEDQGNYGICWIFAGIKSLETYVQLNEGRDLDLSELHADYMTSSLMYGDRDIHSGGHFYTIQQYLRISGAVLESDVPYIEEDYSESQYSKFNNINSVVRVTDTVDFPSILKKDGVALKKNGEEYSDEEINEFRKVIKTHIMKNGSIYASIKPSLKTNIYCNKDCITDHAVSIVGWDDNYSKENFEAEDGSKPTHDGAYIILNSWGEKVGEKGYFYISYDDAKVENEMSGILSTSMDNAIKISTITNPMIKEIIYDELGYYIIKYNGDEYITEEVLKTITDLDLSEKNITSDYLNGLYIFKELRRIDLSNNNITDVSELSKNKELLYINLNNNKVLDVSSLKDLNITVLELAGNKDVTGYEKLNNLDTLDLSNTNLTTLNDISSHKNLSTLNLSNNPKIDYTNFKIPNKLGVLNMDNTNFSNSNLEGISVSKLSIKNNNLKNLDSLKGIKLEAFMIDANLDVSYNNITDFSTLSALNDGKQKINLVAQANNINDISIFNDLNAISSLDLSKNKISDLTNFNSNNIFSIDLSYNKIEKGFNTLKNIGDIYLQHCELSDLNVLSDIEKVNFLNLDDNHITSISGLEKLDKLYTLSLKNNNIADISNISKLKQISNLNLDNNMLTDITPLNDVKNLSSLSLAGNSKIQGKLVSNVSNLNIENCNIDNNFDFSGLKKISYINLNKNNFDKIENILKNTNSSWVRIDKSDLSITEKQFKEMSKMQNLDIDSINININLTLNSENNLNLDDYYYIRRRIMNIIACNDTKRLHIENGTIDIKVNDIHVLDTNNKKVSLTLRNAYSNNRLGGKIMNINISY